MKDFKIDLTGVKGFIAAVLIVLSLLVSVLGAVQNSLPPTVETLGTTNFDAITLSGDLNAGTLSIGSNTLSGFAIISQAVTNGATITHSLGALPKIVCQNRSGGTSTGITDTVWISATTTTTATVGVVEIGTNKMSGDTININCLAFR